MQNKREIFLETLKGKKSQYTPVWFMRQAGRFLKEYKALREKYDFLTMCKSEDLAARVTLLPKSIGVDALILFSDILIPLIAFGAELNYNDDTQPHVTFDLKNIPHTGDLDRISFVFDAIRIVRRKEKDTALLGFAASPFTLLCYVFGGNDFSKLRTFMKNNEEEYFEIADKITNLTIDYLNKQLEAGCDAIQLFDTWAGILSKDDYEIYVLPFVKEISKHVKPSIYFIKNSCHLNELLTELEFDCFSIDWRSSLKEIHENTHKTVQGNLDNTVPLASREIIEKETAKVIFETKNIPHIFNLGHGVLPQTNPDNIKFIVDLVHEKTSS